MPDQSVTQRRFEPVGQPLRVLAVMQHGDDLNDRRLIVDAIPKLIWEDVQAHPADAVVNDRSRVREVFESFRAGVELINESFGLIRRLHVVPSKNAIPIPPGM